MKRVFRTFVWKQETTYSLRWPLLPLMGWTVFIRSFYSIEVVTPSVSTPFEILHLPAEEGYHKVSDFFKYWGSPTSNN